MFGAIQIPVLIGGFTTHDFVAIFLQKQDDK